MIHVCFFGTVYNNIQSFVSGPNSLCDVGVVVLASLLLMCRNRTKTWDNIDGNIDRCVFITQSSCSFVYFAVFALEVTLKSEPSNFLSDSFIGRQIKTERRSERLWVKPGRESQYSDAVWDRTSSYRVCKHTSASGSVCKSEKKVTTGPSYRRNKVVKHRNITSLLKLQ